MKSYVIYKHISPSGKIYIGQTCVNPKQRWNGGIGYKHSKHFYNAILKYGWDNISHEIICEGLNKKEADWLEIYLIAYYNSSDNKYGYNISKGGSGSCGIKCSDEKKIKISKANKGRKHSDETRRKMSKTHKGMFLSDEIKEKISSANTGKKRTESERKRMSEIQKQLFLNNPNRRVEISERRKGSGKPVEQFDLNNNYIKTYKSAKEAALENNFDSSNITKCCKGKKMTHKGFIWKYKENKIEGE